MKTSPYRLLGPIVWVFALMLICNGQEDDGRILLDICDEKNFQALPIGVETTGTILTSNRLLGDPGYEMNMDCTQTLSYPVGGSVTFTFTYLDVEWENDDNKCPYDWFMIDGVKYCGHLTGKSVCVSGHENSQVTLAFYSDDYAETQHHYRGIEVAFSTSFKDHCTCQGTNPVNSQVENCVFPFYFQGVKNWFCSTVSTDATVAAPPFCATAVDESGVLTQSASCDMTINACKRRCLTVETGEECLFPLVVNGVEKSTCQKWSSTEPYTCSTMQGRALTVTNDAISSVEAGDCVVDGCPLEVTCDTQDEALEIGQFLSHSDYNNGKTYPANIDCQPDVYTSAGRQNYYVTINQMDVLCEKNVNFLKIYQKDNVKRSYIFCGDTADTDYEVFSFCFKNTDHIDPFSMYFQFKSGDEVVAARGFLIDFFATNNTVLCPETVENDEACNEGQEVTSDYQILSYDYPLNYASMLNCIWNLKPNPSNSLAYPVVLATFPLRLGVGWMDIEERDSIEIEGENQEPLVYTLDTPIGDYKPYVMMKKSGTVKFTSTYFFNYHTNFNLTVSYLTPNENPQTFIDAGLCLSEDNSDICMFPFEVNSVNYTKCSKFNNGNFFKAYCRNADGVEISCNIDNENCLPPAPNFVGQPNAVTVSGNAVKISWETSDENWDYFVVYHQGALLANTSDKEYTVDNLTPGVSYLVKIQIISFNREGPDADVVFTASDAQVSVYITGRSPSSVTLTWDTFPNDESKYSVIAEPVLETIVAEILFGNLPSSEVKFVEQTVDGGIWEVTIENLAACTKYRLNVTGYNSDEETMMISSSGYTGCQKLTVEENGLMLTMRDDGVLYLDGTMTTNTYFEQIVIEARHAVDYLDGPATSETIEIPEEYQMAVFQTFTYNVDSCIDVDNLSFQNITLGSLMAGTYFEFEIYGEGGLLAGESTVLQYLTDPRVVTSPVVTGATTTSMSVEWVRPEGQYAIFRIELAGISEDVQEEQFSPIFSVNLQNELTGLSPGYTYQITVTTLSYRASQSEPVSFSDDTVPEPVKQFSSFNSDEDPSEILLQILPPSTGWSSFEVESWQLAPDGSQLDAIADIPFPVIITKGTSGYPVVFNKNGYMYSASVVTLSENNRRSEPTKTTFATRPLQADVSIVKVEDDFLTLDWSLTRVDSNYSDFVINILDSQTNELLYQQSFPVLQENSEGTLTSVSIDRGLQSFTVEFITVISNDEFSIEVQSFPTIFNVERVIPRITDWVATLTTLEVTFDASEHGADSIFNAVIMKDGEVRSEVTVWSSDCSSLTNCKASFIDLDPDTEYKIIVGVQETTSLHYSSSPEESINTKNFPTDFGLVGYTASSYSLNVTLSNTPFGFDSDIIDYSIFIAEASDTSVSPMTIGSTWYDYIQTLTAYQATFPQPYPMTLDEDQLWTVTIGDEICDVTHATICNGPLVSSTQYTMWVLGTTTNGFSFLSNPITGFETTNDDIGNVEVLEEVELTSMNIRFSPTLPNSASYNITLVDISEFELESREIEGISCAPNCEVIFTDLSLDSTYYVTIKPFYSGVERKPETIMFTTNQEDESCDANCFDYDRTCRAFHDAAVYEQIVAEIESGQFEPDTVPPPKPDCSLDYYKERCYRSCNQCTPCSYATLNVVETEVTQLNFQVAGLQNQLNEMNEKLEKLMNGPAMQTTTTSNQLRILKVWCYNATSTYSYTDSDGEVVFLGIEKSLDGNYSVGDPNCYQNGYPSDNDGVVTYIVGATRVQSVHILIGSYTSGLQMHSARVQVCTDDDDATCGECEQNIEMVTGGQWASAHCANTEGNVVKVKNTNNPIVICEIYFVGV